MKTLLKISGIIAALVVLFAVTVAAFAQGPANAAGSAGGNQTPANTNLNLNLVDESVMHAAIADALGISVDELEAALAAGETPATLALELGVDFAEVRAAMDAVHDAAIQQAVADGLITQEQADWLLSHRGGQAGQQGGSANGAGSRGGHGAGGNGGNGGICPNVTP